MLLIFAITVYQEVLRMWYEIVAWMEGPIFVNVLKTLISWDWIYIDWEDWYVGTEVATQRLKDSLWADKTK